jgi:hypothetical protein
VLVRLSPVVELDPAGARRCVRLTGELSSWDPAARCRIASESSTQKASR